MRRYCDNLLKTLNNCILYMFTRMNKINDVCESMGRKL